MYIVGGLLLLALIFGPQIWVRVVKAWYGAENANIPGTGGELAVHLLNRFDISDVEVETTTRGNHYDPNDRKVRLTADIHDKRSLTAIAIAAHEVAPAIQHHRGEIGVGQREVWVAVADRWARRSASALMLAPIAGLLLRHPVPVSVMVLVGLSGMIARMFVHVRTLPVEWDASFAKAMPILVEGDYISPAAVPATRRILRAAALTYVAAALADILNLARWAALLLRR